MLKRIYRVTKEKEFQAVYRRGKFKSTALFSVHFLPNRYDFSRIGIVVSKKISKKATDRNLIKRRVREVMKDLQPTTLSHYDIVIAVKKPALEKSFEEVKNELTILLTKAGITK
jgi:ribonuclease P protein component